MIELKFDVKLKNNADDPWGISAPFSKSYTEWTLNPVEDGKQGHKLGLQQKDKILGYNGIELNDKNHEGIKDKLFTGEACTLKFGRYVDKQGTEEEIKKI